MKTMKKINLVSKTFELDSLENWILHIHGQHLG